jgi:tetratricopeptide (TPR) repeat protein
MKPKPDPDPSPDSTPIQTAVVPAPQEQLSQKPDYHLRALRRQIARDWDGAIADFTEAIALNSLDANSYCGRGCCKHEKRDWDGAIADYTKAIEVAPSYSVGYFGRGRAKEAKGDSLGAKIDFTRSNELDDVPDMNLGTSGEGKGYDP